ncbi:MAG: hypothetical protein QY322_03295 [bacterium]|nr:MAG: hypothetical protein QY322_03295 [bacterium]
MSDASIELIEKHERLEPHESDNKTREVAAARLWVTGDDLNMRIAEKIWKETGTLQPSIQSLKDHMLQLKNK